MALVTGASSGIGHAIAVALAAKVASVWLVGRRRDALDETASAVRARGADAHPISADLTSPDDLDALQGAVDGTGRLDVLVQAAGHAALGHAADAPVAELDAQYEANLRAPYRLTQLALPLLRRSGGDIVFVNSTSALTPRAGSGAYAATKAGLRALADSLRQEVHADGVRVLSVFPGRTATPMQDAIHTQEGRDYRPERLLSADDVAAMVVAALELPRTAEVREIAMRPMLRPT